MSVETALLRAILASPDDDTPRLVYADWLEDNAHLGPPGRAERAELIRVQCELARLPYDDDRVSDLQAREYRLLAHHFEEWDDGLRPAEMQRGFIEKWKPASRWQLLEYAGEVFGCHPIRELLLGPDARKGWGREVAECCSLCRVQTLALRCREFEEIAPAEVQALLSSPYLTDMKTLILEGGGSFPLRRLLGAKNLAPSLQHLRRLSVRGRTLTESDLIALVRSALAETLTHLQLSDHSSFMPPGGIAALTESPLWPRLEGLDLGNNFWDDGEALRLLAGALPRSGIRQLGLAFAAGPEVASGDVVGALTSTPSWARLEALDLAGNSLGDEEAFRLTSWPGLSGLRWLNLSHNELTDLALKRLAGCPAAGGLTALQLAGNELSDVGLEALAASPHLSRLTYLNLENTRVGELGVAAFARSANAARLRVWGLPEVGEQTLQVIAASPMLRQLTKLRFLGDSRERPAEQGAGVLALAQSEHLPNLVSLETFGGYLSNATWEAVLACERLAYPYRPGRDPMAAPCLPCREPEVLFPWAAWRPW